MRFLIDHESCRYVPLSLSNLQELSSIDTESSSLNNFFNAEKEVAVERFITGEGQVIGVPRICNISFGREGLDSLVARKKNEICQVRTCRATLWQLPIEKSESRQEIHNVRLVPERSEYGLDLCRTDRWKKVLDVYAYEMLFPDMESCIFENAFLRSESCHIVGQGALI